MFSKLKMKCYKLLNKDLTCNEYQYEIGKEHIHDGPLEMCWSGFHSCTDPRCCILYYENGQLGVECTYVQDMLCQHVGSEKTN